MYGTTEHLHVEESLGTQKIVRSLRVTNLQEARAVVPKTDDSGWKRSCPFGKVSSRLPRTFSTQYEDN